MKSLYYIIICMLHILVWLYILFGGLITLKSLFIIIFLINPIIYIIHILPFHIFIKSKLKEINDNYNKYLSEIDKLKLNNFNDKYLYIYNDLIASMTDNISEERKLMIAKLYILHQHEYIIPKLHQDLEYCFRNSFGNPVSPQGMIILSYIINIFLLKFYWKKI